MEVDAGKGVLTCPLSGYQRKISGLQNTSLHSQSDMQEYLNRNNFTVAIKKKTDEAAKSVRATVEDECPKCGHTGMEFYTMQLRSADEGQTVFYECPGCGHKFSQNN
ncbi:hypothetical protein WJX84_011885 [Apatococcus fuscideae]|uniref:DNA-directed RNA polymerase subunit n=1 Tax=Apatococcus fuscideae TaxID=2026836 RepID=A0AAW1SR25_9CHLO